MANFAQCDPGIVSSVDGNGNVALSTTVTMFNGSQIATQEVVTAYFAPTIANSRTALTDIAVATFLSTFGTALARTAVALFPMQAGL